MNYYVYILRCADRSLYTGITTDIKRRIDEHNGISGELGVGAKYTSARRPVEVVYSVKTNNRSEAAKEEFRIKNLTKKGKESLISKI